MKIVDINEHLNLMFHNKAEKSEAHDHFLVLELVIYIIHE